MEGFNLRRLRFSKGFTVSRLAEKSGVSAPTISRLERFLGKRLPDPDTICKLAMALKEDPEALCESYARAIEARMAS